jgi:hypothetical protein
MRQRHAYGVGTTIVSRTGISPRESERAMLLLRAAGRELPVGSTVAVIKPARRSERDDELTFFIATGQLPRQHVVMPATLNAPAAAPDYLIALGAPSDDPRYRTIHAFDGGTIDQRR